VSLNHALDLSLQHALSSKFVFTNYSLVTTPSNVDSSAYEFISTLDESWIATNPLFQLVDVVAHGHIFLSLFFSLTIAWLLKSDDLSEDRTSL
jgi:hypothetical protein